MNAPRGFCHSKTTVSAASRYRFQNNAEAEPPGASHIC